MQSNSAALRSLNGRPLAPARNGEEHAREPPECGQQDGEQSAAEIATQYAGEQADRDHASEMESKAAF